MPSRTRRLRRAAVAVLAATLLSPGPQSVAPVSADGELAPLAPGQTQQGLSREVFGFLPYWELDPGMADYLRYDLLTTIAFFGVSYQADGTLDTTLAGYKAYLSGYATDVITRAHAAGVRTVVTFQGFSLSRNAAFLADPTARATFVQQAVALMTARGADGANLDIENLDSQYFDEFALLGAELKAAALAVNPNAQISVATNANVSGARMAAAALAAGVDRAFLMGYNYRVAASSPVGGIDPIVRADGGLSLSASLDLYAQYGVPLERVILGVGYYGRTWPTTGPELHASRQTDTATYGSPKVFYPRTLPGSGVGTTLDYDQVEQVARLVSWDAVRSTWIQTYYNDPLTLAAKMAFAKQRGLAGLGIWALGYDRGQTADWDVIANAFAIVTVTGVTVVPAGPSAGPALLGFSNTLDVLVSVTARSSAAPATEVSLSHDSVAWSDWQPLTSSVAWQLSPGPDGPRDVWVRVRTTDGAQSPAFLSSLVMDTTPPVLGAVTLQPWVGSGAGKRDVPVRILWWVSDGGPVASSTIEVSTDGGPYVAAEPLPDARFPDLMHLEFGPRYGFRVDVTDGAGNAGAPVETGPVTFTKIENTSRAIGYAGGWRQVLARTASSGSVTEALRRGSTATYRFTGSGFAILGPTGPTRGAGRVTIDGAASGMFSGYAKGGTSRRILYSSALTPGSHTVVITVAGTRGHPAVDLDALIVTR